ncbi:MAG: hypothetical protein O9295_25045 [Microcystis sp. LE18-22.4A]|nr:hypothetical protein [Microcystis sp. LE18-22.4A]
MQETGDYFYLFFPHPTPHTPHPTPHTPHPTPHTPHPTPHSLGLVYVSRGQSAIS